jgi:hypothetical protein
VRDGAGLGHRLIEELQHSAINALFGTDLHSIARFIFAPTRYCPRLS